MKICLVLGFILVALICAACVLAIVRRIEDEAQDRTFPP